MKKLFNFNIIKKIFHGPDPTDSSVLLTHKNIYIFPSKIGFFWFFLLLIMFLIGLNYRNNLVLIFFFFLISISVLSLIYNFLQLYQLKIIPSGKVSNVFKGDIGKFFVYLRNDKGIERYLTIISEGIEEDIVVPEHSTKIALYGGKTKNRGIFYAPKFTIVSYYPFGIFRCWTVLRFKDLLIVYPKPKKWDMKVNYINLEENIQQNVVARYEGYEDFSSLERYDYMDSPSRIYWKLYAKRDELAKMVFSGNNFGALQLDLDEYIKLPIEEALEILCYLVIQCDKKGILYGIKLKDYVIPPSNGIKHKDKCLTALALYPNFGD